MLFTMNPTPRTDAAIVRAEIHIGSLHVQAAEGPEFVPAEFARQLERELREALKLDKPNGDAT